MSDVVNNNVTQPVDQPAAQPVNQPAAQPVDQPAAQPVNQPAAQPVNQPAQGNSSVKDLYNPSNKNQTTADPDPVKGLYGDPQADNPNSAQQDGKKDQQSEAPQVPETYNFENVKPENGIAYTDTDVELVSKLGKALGLTNDQARLMMEKGGVIYSEVLGAARDAQLQKNIAEIKNDPELGGANFNSTRANLNRVNERYFGNGNEAYNLLEQTGLIAHPAIVRLFNQIGKDLGEEQKFVGNAANRAPVKVNRLRALYNNSPDMDFGD